MKRVFIIHRWSGGPKDDWRPWIKTELEKLGYQVFVPQMPDPETPVMEKWVGELARVVGTPDKDTYFIGHSIGCQVILRYLETREEQVGGAIFVAGWFNLKNLEDREAEQVAKPWIETPINADKVKAVCLKSTLLISDNDPYDCFEENKKAFEALGSKIVIVPNAGHFTEGDGYKEFLLLLEEFKKHCFCIIKTRNSNYPYRFL